MAKEILERIEDVDPFHLTKKSFRKDFDPADTCG
jgi:hypothetical protein